MSRCLKDIRKKNIKTWKNRVLKLLQILSSIQSSQSTIDTIHVKDLELILNGLGFFPGDIHLDEMSFEIRFRDRYSLAQNFIKVRQTCVFSTSVPLPFKSIRGQKGKENKFLDTMRHLLTNRYEFQLPIDIIKTTPAGGKFLQ